jgi:hypothetical protein
MQVEGVKRVRVKVDELDQRTASLHINVEGNNLSLEDIAEKLTGINCALHSVDEVICEERD